MIDWNADPDPWMRKVLDAAPPLSDWQRTALAELLKPARVSLGVPLGGAA